MNDTLDRHVRRHRLCDAGRLTASQQELLLQQSLGSCQSCGRHEALYRQHTAGADPTCWLLCSRCHPSPDQRSLELDEEFAVFLSQPESSRLIAEAIRSAHDAWWQEQHAGCPWE